MLHSLLHQWEALTGAQQVLYGLGGFSFAIIAVLTLFRVSGFELHCDAIERPRRIAPCLFSVNPVVGFFLCFGGIGGWVAGHGMSFLFVLLLAVVAGALGSLAMYCTMRLVEGAGCPSSTSARFISAVGRLGTVCVALPPRAGAGGRISVFLNTGSEVIPALWHGSNGLTQGTEVVVESALPDGTLVVQPRIPAGARLPG
jgi:hypothetical protein